MHDHWIVVSIAIVTRSTAIPVTLQRKTTLQKSEQPPSLETTVPLQDGSKLWRPELVLYDTSHHTEPRPFNIKAPQAGAHGSCAAEQNQACGVRKGLTALHVQA